jgi:hypothetical protein
MAYVFSKAQIKKLNLYTHSSSTGLVLTSEHSGSVILLDNSSNNLEATLPGVTNNAGLNFTFLLTNTASAATVKIFSKTSVGVFESKLKSKCTSDTTLYNTFKITSATTRAILRSGENSELAARSPHIGDKLEALCDGSHWYISIVDRTMNSYNLEASS